MKNIVVPILGAVSIVSTGALAWLLATPPSVDPRAVKLESELKEARQAIANLKAELARKPAAPAAPGIASAPAPAPGPLATSPDAETPGKKNLREMFSTPEMRAVLDQQQAAQIELGYSQLFAQLNLAPEEREHFKKLLIARQKIQTDMSLQLLDPNLSEAKRQELIAEVKHQMSVYDTTIKSFLNDDNDFKNFHQWEATQPERTQFDTVGRSLFAASSEPLSQSQEQQLINLMAEARQSTGGGLNDMTGTNPNNLTDEIIARHKEQSDALPRIVSERAEAAGFLTPGQQQTLNSYLNQLRVMADSTRNMTELMLRGSKN